MAEFTRVLEAHRIEAVLDVRRFPGSRRLPHFEASALDAALAGAGIAYHWIPALGGRRRETAVITEPRRTTGSAKSSAASTGSAWRHPAFRAYADHLRTDAFAEGLAELLAIAHGLRSAIMCAEILWWRCHRRLIADALTSLGVEVVHIRDASHADVHRIAPPATMRDGQLSYAAEHVHTP